MALQLNGIREETYYDHDYGYDESDFLTTTYDIGAIYRMGNLQFGFASMNLVGKLFDYDYDLVKIQRLGAAYSQGKYLLSADIKKEGEAGTSLNAGAQWELAEMLKLRGGWRFKEDFGGLTFGLGLEIGGLNFDYAFLSYGDLGNMHKAGLSFAFGKSKEKKQEEPVPKKQEKLNAPPQVLWQGEGNYVSDGLHPETGNTSTAFVYRVRYKDDDGDLPAKGFPQVYIKKGEVQLPGSPFAMNYVSGTPEKGSVYEYSLSLPEGADYGYYFSARDILGNEASGAATTPTKGPIVSPETKPVITGQMNIAVADFTGKNVSQADASIVADFMRTELVNTGLFNVMDRNNMEIVLAEQKFQTSGCTEQQCAVEMGKLLNVKKMIVGSLSKLLEVYYITVNVVDVETGKITASFDSSAGSSKELREACKEISKKLAQ